MVMKSVLGPSLLSADFSELGEEVKRIERAGVTHLHLDVMDGQFVPNISFGPAVISALQKKTSLFFDAHLMVREPDFLVEPMKKAGCRTLTVQYEACTHLQRQLKRIRDAGMLAGVALNPATPPSVLEYVWEDLDLILVMSVNPGFGGQEFLPLALKKIRELRTKIDASGRNIILEVDGGVKLNNVKEVISAGCDWVVAGSAVFAPEKTEENARQFLKTMNECV